MGDTNFSSVSSAGTLNSDTLVKGANFKRGTVTFDIVRGTSSGSSSKAVAHGLTSVAMAVAMPMASNATLANNAVIFTGKTSGGTTTFYGWKHTGAGTPTLKAATTIASFNYLVIGTA